MIKRTLILLFAGIGLLVAAPPPGTQVHKDIAYVENGGPDRTLDLYLPEKVDGKLPVVVWIHGGAWRSGKKGGWCPAFGLLARGYAVADINYRLSVADNAPFPAQLYDCKAVIRWLRANAAQYSLDPDHIGVWGHSAGGHLSAMVGLTGSVAKLEGDEGNLTYSSAVQAVCDWSGPTDLVGFLHRDVASTKSMVVNLLGGSDLTVANDEKAAAASPLTYVAPGAPPFMIAQGEKDDVVPYQEAVNLDAALKKAGDDSTLIPVPDKGHGIGGPELEKQADDFFDQHLKAAAAPATH
jgi:acetyl esterase/lipase